MTADLPRRAREPGSDALPRPDWRETFALAADLALAGIIVAVGCLTIVGAGGVLVTASVAVNQAVVHRSFPSAASLWQTLRSSLGRGFVAVAVAGTAVALIWLDAAALRSGRVPGGTPALIGLGLVAAALVAVAAVALVRLGQTGGREFRPALRYALHVLGTRPLLGPAVLATLVVPVVLAWLMPILVILLGGVALFAVHVVVQRAVR
jgi:hypothetical protein